MTPKEFRERAEKHYKKLGVKNLSEFLEIAGYSPNNKLSNLYQCGVGKRMEAFLIMLEKKDNNNSL